MTAWARLARENSEQSCGNGGAMESQQPAFHSSLGISQKTRDSHIPTASGDGLFYWNEKRLKSKKTKAVYTEVLTPPALLITVSLTFSSRSACYCVPQSSCL